MVQLRRAITARSRRLLAAAATLILHGAVLLFVVTSDVKQRFTPSRRIAIQVTAPPRPVTTEDVPKVEPSPPQEPIRTDAPGPSAPQNPQAPPPPSPAPPPTPSPSALAQPQTPPPTSLRRPPRGQLERVVGGAASLPDGLAPSLRNLEGALELRAAGPRSDIARAGAAVREHLLTDLAGDAVSVGLADDYFRTLREHVELAWRPAPDQLNDAGERVSQMGMMRDLVEERGAWDEMWRAYLDLAKQYARGTTPRLPPKRLEQLRELMRSRKGMFRVHAISEVKLTQGPDGKLLALEMPLPSGHPAVDEGVRVAFVEALHAMPDDPPARVHRGRSFSSWWRLRATWTMVPPTALLTGAAFDVTPKGFTIDVPFDIKLQTVVLLQRTDVRPGVVGAKGAGAAAP